MVDQKHYTVQGGLSPRTQKRITSDAVPTIARDVNFRHGDIRPWACPTVECRHDFVVETILDTPDCKCVAFDECLSFVYFPMNNGANCQFYVWVDPDEGARVASVPDFCAGESCPLGVECPAEPAWISSGQAGEDCDCNYTAYLITYVDKYGRESAPSLPTDLRTVPEGGTNCLSIPQPADPCIVSIRLYRLFKPWSDGTNNEAVMDGGFHRVEDLPVGTTEYCDSASTQAADIPLSTTRSFPPPERLGGIELLRNGALVGWRRNILYFSDPMQTHAWGRQNDLVLDHNIKKVIAHGDKFYVLTDGNPYHVTIRTNDDGYWYDWRMIEEKLPMISKRGCTSNQDGVFYVSTNGIVMLSQTRDGLRATMISAQWWLPEDWCKLNAEDACLAAFSGMLFLFNVTDPIEKRQTSYIFQYPNENYGEPGMLTEYTRVTPQACYCRPDGTLLMAEGKKVYRWNWCTESGGCGDDCCPYHVRLRLAYMPEHSRWSSFRVLKQEGDLTMCFRRNDCDGPCEWDVCKIDDCEPHWLPSQGRGHDYEVELKGCAVVESFSLAKNHRLLARSGV